MPPTRNGLFLSIYGRADGALNTVWIIHALAEHLIAPADADNGRSLRSVRNGAIEPSTAQPGKVGQGGFGAG